MEKHGKKQQPEKTRTGRPITEVRQRLEGRGWSSKDIDLMIKLRCLF